ncbi:MAG: type II secretion system F family protein [Succiniclasticum sp.]|uniref:type II secretion system F family protein n=1 Tax=Succiniclasticum sp. TaxID=2775030 RepID=UPI002A91BB95|nr:type II secretion system F family protein [Succiniclasticum sp.]MDY6290802.1 type II secretion system F family protein [Succiniclasticum sp.]
MIFLVSLISTIFILLILILLLEYRSRNRRALARRMRYYAGEMENPHDKPNIERKTLTERLMNLLHSGGRLLSNIRHARGLDFKMQQAGIPLLGTEFVALLLLSAVIVGVIAVLVAKKWYVGILAAIVIVAIEYIYVLVRIEHRSSSFTNQLGDCLMMVANALRAGFSFLQAMEMISKEMEPPISDEFKHVMRDIGLGATVERALDDMDKRVGSPDFSLVVTAVLIQQQVGGDLAQILDTISETIQDRIRMRREVKTLTTQGRMSGWILILTPVVLALIMTSSNPDYLDPLFKHPIGQIILAATIIMEIIGAIIINRIVDIEI